MAVFGSSWIAFIVWIVPLDPDGKALLSAALYSTYILAIFVVYALLDGWLARKGKK